MRRAAIMRKHKSRATSIERRVARVGGRRRRVMSSGRMRVQDASTSTCMMQVRVACCISSRRVLGTSGRRKPSKHAALATCKSARHTHPQDLDTHPQDTHPQDLGIHVSGPGEVGEGQVYERLQLLHPLGPASRMHRRHSRLARWLLLDRELHWSEMSRKQRADRCVTPWRARVCVCVCVKEREGGGGKAALLLARALSKYRSCSYSR